MHSLLQSLVLACGVISTVRGNYIELDDLAARDVFAFEDLKARHMFAVDHLKARDMLEDPMFVVDHLKARDMLEDLEARDLDELYGDLYNRDILEVSRHFQATLSPFHL